jgi:hypothetical protein
MVINSTHCQIRKTCEDPMRKQQFLFCVEACLFSYGASLMIEEGSFAGADSSRRVRVQARARMTKEAAN